MSRFLPLHLAAACALLAACGDDTQLAPASIPNVVDTLTLGALNSSPISVPSGYSVADGNAVRTDLSSGFDFVYDVDSAGQHVFIPIEAMGLGGTNGNGPGLQYYNGTFEQLANAPINGYITNDTIVLDSGTVLAVRSRIVCTGLGVPIYGKVEVLGFDDTPGNQQVTIQALSDENCGYKSLRIGLPKD